MADKAATSAWSGACQIIERSMMAQTEPEKSERQFIEWVREGGQAAFVNCTAQLWSFPASAGYDGDNQESNPNDPVTDEKTSRRRSEEKQKAKGTADDQGRPPRMA